MICNETKTTQLFRVKFKNSIELKISTHKKDFKVKWKFNYVQIAFLIEHAKAMKTIINSKANRGCFNYIFKCIFIYWCFLGFLLLAASLTQFLTWRVLLSSTRNKHLYCVFKYFFQIIKRSLYKLFPYVNLVCIFQIFSEFFITLKKWKKGPSSLIKRYRMIYCQFWFYQRDSIFW